MFPPTNPSDYAVTQELNELPLEELLHLLGPKLRNELVSFNVQFKMFSYEQIINVSKRWRQGITHSDIRRESPLPDNRVG